MRYASSLASSVESLSKRTITYIRSGSLPSSASLLKPSIVAKLEPASWNVVTPFESASSPASCTILRKRFSSSAFEGLGNFAVAARMRPCACSRRRPVGSPVESLTISPPSGLGVLRVMPASRSAAPFTNDAWPLACDSDTGLFGLTRSSDACSGTPSTFGCGGWSHFSWCQPCPSMSDPRGATSTAVATCETMSSQLRAFVRSRISFEPPSPV